MFDTKERYCVVACRKQPELEFKSSVVTTQGRANTEEKYTEIGSKVLTDINKLTGQDDWFILSIGLL
jgi:hypothetical protein